MKCDFCNQQEEHYALDHRLCTYHYCTMRGFDRCPKCDEKFKQLKKCIICGDMAITRKHHVNYFQEQIQQVCSHCHQLIHKTKRYPESNLFYKGVIE